MQPSGRRDLMAAACAGTFVFGVGLATMGAILPALSQRVGFDTAAAGDLFAASTASMLVVTLLFGPLVDRFGYKAFLVVSASLVTAAFLLLAVASTYPVVVAAAVLSGLGGGGLNGGTNALVNDIHRPADRGAALNILGVFLGVGAVAIPLLIGSALSTLGLPNILRVAVALSLVPIAFFARLTFPGPKQPHGFPLAHAARLATEPLLWLCAFTVFFESTNEATLAGWTSTYLEKDFGIDPGSAALVLAGFWAMLLAGRVVASRLVRVLGDARLVLLGALVAVGTTSLARFSPSGAAAAAGLLLTGFACAAVVPTVLSVVGNAFPAFSGTAFGLVFGIGMLGSMGAPWLVGQIARDGGLRRGFILPVIGCAMVAALQWLVMRVLERRRSAAVTGAPISPS